MSCKPEQCAAAALRLARKLDHTGFPLMASLVGITDPDRPQDASAMVVVATGRGMDLLMAFIHSHGGIESMALGRSQSIEIVDENQDGSS